MNKPIVSIETEPLLPFAIKHPALFQYIYDRNHHDRVNFRQIERELETSPLIMLWTEYETLVYEHHPGITGVAFFVIVAQLCNYIQESTNE